MGCWLGHDAKIISTETLIVSPHYGFIFMKCRTCGKRRIDGTSFKGNKKGKWVDNWKDNGGIMPQISLPDKYCPKCNKKMKKTTAFGGEWTCHPTINELKLMRNEYDYHYETIKAKPDDYIEI